MIDAELRKRLWLEHYVKFEGVARLMDIPSLRRSILSCVASEERVRAAAQEDEHLNNIPLKKWDVLAGCIPRPSKEKLNTVGESFWSLSTGVCVLKHIARYYIANMEPPR